MAACPYSKLKILCVLCVLLLLGFSFQYVSEYTHKQIHFITSKHQNKRRQQLYSGPPEDGVCSCSSGATNFKHLIPKERLEELSGLRHNEFQSLKSRTFTLLNAPLHATPNSPLQYPIQGYLVRPLTPTHIPDLSLMAEDQNNYQVSLTASKGVFMVSGSEEGVSVTGSRTDELIIQSNSLQKLNGQLTHVLYESKEYHVNDGDLVTFSFEKHQAVIPVVIRQPEMPFMRDLGKDINSHVTVTTKIKQDYSPVRVLLGSIREFYPEVPVVIVDDNTEREEISGKHIEQYFMPPKKGWFAGRSLAVTQVNTKYFLWVDDDFLFTENTRLEKFVEVMEANPELDVLGGVILGKKSYFTLLYEEGDEVDGGCLHMKFDSKFNTLPNYPECSMVSGVTNFFLGRTDTVMAVGFDPNLSGMANPELFIDGLGSLMVASCEDLTSMSINPQNEDEQENTFELPDAEQSDYRHSIYYFKNHLKCAEYL